MRITVFGLLAILLVACSDGAPRALGTLERDRLTLIAPVTSEITAINVSEGQHVKAGEVLMLLDSTAAKARVEQSQAELAQAKARLEELITGARTEEIGRAKAMVAGAEASLKEAQQSFERAKRLFAARMVTAADYDAAKAALDFAVSKKNEAQQSLNELENGTRSEQIDQARAAVTAANAQVTIAQKALEDMTLVAAQDAIVDTLPWRVGDRVAAGTQLIGLLATNAPYARVYLPETWLDHVKPGSKLMVYVDGWEQPIEGTVRNIRSQPAYTPFYALNERDRARLMYLTDITLSEKGQDLPTGIALEVGLPQ